MMRKMELLAPAGDREKLLTALHFGADAVYCAPPSFGLRKGAKNFTLEDFEEIVPLVHSKGAKIYITLNAIPHDADLEDLPKTLDALEKAKVDGLIISDPGIFMQAKQRTTRPLHISTQASITNTPTIKFWKDLGAERIVLARECSGQEMQTMKQAVGNSMEFEVFVHGAMCISHSGRCLLSNYMTGRDSNRGDCAQACRWKYALVERGRPDEAYPIYEEGQSAYILNSKDLCLLPQLPLLSSMGMDSLKIEGRMKSAYYVGSVVHVYREALDALYAGNWTEEKVAAWMRELQKTSHRAFTEAFFEGKAGVHSQFYESSRPEQPYDFMGRILSEDGEGWFSVECRNRFATGDVMESIGRKAGYQTLRIVEILDEQNSCSVANVPKHIYKVHFASMEDMPITCEPGDLLRREKIEAPISNVLRG